MRRKIRAESSCERSTVEVEVEEDDEDIIVLAGIKWGGVEWMHK